MQHLQNGMGGQVNGANVNGSVGDGLRNEDFPALGGSLSDKVSAAVGVINSGWLAS